MACRQDQMESSDISAVVAAALAVAATAEPSPELAELRKALARVAMVPPGRPEPEPAPVVRLQVVRAAKPAPVRSKGTAESFHNALRAAIGAACAQHGDRWALVPGASGWTEIPGRLRSFKTERGISVRLPSSFRVPVASFWPGGAIPAGLALVPDGATETRPREWVEVGFERPGHLPNYAEWKKKWLASPAGKAESRAAQEREARELAYRAEDKARDEAANERIKADIRAAKEAEIARLEEAA